MCYLALGFGLPLAYPLSTAVYGSSVLDPHEPVFCLLVPINSLVSISIIYLILGVLQRLRSARSRLAQQKA